MHSARYHFIDNPHDGDLEREFLYQGNLGYLCFCTQHEDFIDGQFDNHDRSHHQLPDPAAGRYLGVDARWQVLELRS